MRALDFYSGVGGWSLGLMMAGIDVVQSYEKWTAANVTNQKNNRHETNAVDIRNLDFGKLPGKIDFVVGSPPCTQFSLANRGGGGDHKDGLIDIIRFFEIVDHVCPKKWAMENVPSVAPIIASEIRRGGCLYRFRHLGIDVEVFNLEQFGLPQRRRRCIAGNFDFDLLKSYRAKAARRNLGSVIRAFAASPIVDPVYGFTLAASDLYDHNSEEHLNAEEERINRTAKVAHPIYNSMQFPDLFDRPVRTITATSTRVSRESVVIEDVLAPGRYRRLTIRESASAQGFPANFQFFGTSYGQKMRMVGNAIPPLFSFYLGQALLGTRLSALKSLREGIRKFQAPDEKPIEAKLERAGFKYPLSRRFRFSIPNLRLKSGVRFELANEVNEPDTKWSVSLYFGSSKDIKRLILHASLLDKSLSRMPSHLLGRVQSELCALELRLAAFSAQKMQRAWRHEMGYESSHPFGLLDCIGETGAVLTQVFELSGQDISALIIAAISSQFRRKRDEGQIIGLGKLSKHAPMVLSGILVGATVNIALAKVPAELPINRPTRREREVGLAV